MKIKPLNAIEKSIEDYVVNTCGLTYSVHYTGTHNHYNWDCDGWAFTIKGQVFDYFTGLGHRDQSISPYSWDNIQSPRELAQWKTKNTKPQVPPIAGLLYSLILDSSACNESFEAWCENFGYDADSRKVLKMYEQCQKSFDKLCKVFTTAQIEHMTRLLENY